MVHQLSRILKLELLWRRPGEFSAKKNFFIEGLREAPEATGAETNTTRMIFVLVAPGKMSNRSIGVVLGALNDSFEVGCAPAEQNRS